MPGLAGLARRVVQILWRRVPLPLRTRLMPYLLDDLAELDKLRLGLPTMEGLLRHARANGFQPRAIIDVGANVGDWSRMAASVFPDATIAMVDGNPEVEPALRRAQAELGSRSRYVIALLGPAARDRVTFYTAGAGSGVLLERTTFERGRLTLPMTTLDESTGGPASGWSAAPTLMKLDVQGFELEVLRGAPARLAEAEMVIVETALLPFNQDGALLADVVAFMAGAGFVVYDFCGQYRRETDRALFQTDLAFVRHESDLRRPRKFFLREPD